jgi:hypothetical protein
VTMEPTTDIVVFSLGVAALCCAARWSASMPKPNDRLSATGWALNGSWASNLTAVGSILGIVVGNSGGLVRADLTVAAFVLSVFFGVLIILGPITIAALSVADSHGTGTEGTVLGFFVSSGLSLWAAVGEVTTAAGFLLNLRQKLPASFVGIFVAVLALVVIILLRYAWLQMGVIVKSAAPPPPIGPNVQRPKQPGTWHLL